MKIHYAFYTAGYHNTYPYDLKEAIQHQGCDATYGLSGFWNPIKNIDILHIHWPESLFKWAEPNIKELIYLEKILDIWKKNNTKIVVTRHNFSRHSFGNKSIYEKSNYDKLYELVYSYSNGIIHLGKFSLDDFKKRYQEFKYDVENAIIPHGIYEKYPNNSNKVSAREKLNIPKNAKVVLVFGTLRNFEEVNFIQNVFKEVQLNKKILIGPRWKFSSDKYLKKFQKLYYLLHPQYKLNDKLIDNNNIHLYFNSADVVFIPRINNLNSGVLILGYSFGKVVVGPDFGNVGEILQETKNPFYSPQIIESAVQAIEKAFRSDLNKLGIANFNYAKQSWNWDIVGKKHYEFYKKIIGKKNS